MDSKKKNQDVVILGKIIISSEVHKFEKGIAYITLIDTTNQDIATVPLAETVISGIRHNEGETILDFHLEIAEEKINSKNDYSVQVWIDTTGSGKPEKGDLFTDRQYPVLTHNWRNNPTIRFDGD